VKSEPTLRERAIAHLARREHTRAELARKLASHADSPKELADLLDDLSRRKLISDERFAVTRSESLARKFGAARVVRELRGKGVADDAVERISGELKASELERARAVWQKRFGAPARNAGERAKQGRFLQARGFSFEVIQRVLRGQDDE
jgi:regulatory protein